MKNFLTALVLLSAACLNPVPPDAVYGCASDADCPANFECQRYNQICFQKRKALSKTCQAYRDCMAVCDFLPPIEPDPIENCANLSEATAQCRLQHCGFAQAGSADVHCPHATGTDSTDPAAQICP